MPPRYQQRITTEVNSQAFKKTQQPSSLFPIDGTCIHAKSPRSSLESLYPKSAKVSAFSIPIMADDNKPLPFQYQFAAGAVAGVSEVRATQTIGQLR